MFSILPVGFMFSDFINEGAPSTAINKLNGLSVGDSLIGDCYANFGIWGAIAFGLLMYLIYGLMNRSKVRNKEYRISLYCSLSFIMLNLVRASFFEAVRPTAWLFIVILLFGRFTKAEEV